MNKELEIELMKMFIKNNLKQIDELTEKILLLCDENDKYQIRLSYLEGKK